MPVSEKPQVWYVRNSTIDSKYQAVNAEFDVSEEIDGPGKFPGMTGNQIRAQVHQMAGEWNPFWFVRASTSKPSTCSTR